MKTLDELPELLKPREVSSYLKISIKTLKRNKKILFTRIGNRGDRRYLKKDLIKFLEENYDNN